MVLALVGLIGSKNCRLVFALPTKNKQGITNKSSWLEKPSVVCATPSHFQIHWRDWFKFCFSLVCEKDQIIPSVYGCLKVVVSMRLWLAQYKLPWFWFFASHLKTALREYGVHLPAFSRDPITKFGSNYWFTILHLTTRRNVMQELVMVECCIDKITHPLSANTFNITAVKWYSVLSLPFLSWG